jgi:hypothetical protein
MANYDTTAKYSLLLTIPPANDHSPRDAWENIGTNLLRSVRDGQLNPAVKSYATMVSAFVPTTQLLSTKPWRSTASRWPTAIRPN